MRLLVFAAALATCGLLACSPQPHSGIAQRTDNEPDPRFFHYYDPVFRDSLQHSELRLDGLFFRILQTDVFGDYHQLIRFYPDGLVLVYKTYASPDAGMTFEKRRSGNIHGYYGIKGDSLFFSTRVYYQHQPVFYSGKILGDSLLIREGSSISVKSPLNSYYFLEEKTDY